MTMNFCLFIVLKLGKQKENPNRSIKCLLEVFVPYIINTIQGVEKK